VVEPPSRLALGPKQANDYRWLLSTSSFQAAVAAVSTDPHATDAIEALGERHSRCFPADLKRWTYRCTRIMDSTGMPGPEGAAIHPQGYDGKVLSRVAMRDPSRNEPAGPGWPMQAHAGPCSDWLDAQDAALCFSISFSSRAWMWANS
jgi:hypothetical protein